MSETLRDAALDLLLGSCCVGCSRPGRPWCAACERAHPARPLPAWPSPTPPGLVLPVAAGPYADGLRRLVVAFKEERVRAVELPLARRLAAAAGTAVDVATGRGPVPGPVVLVPVPSRRSSVRSRGLDTTAALARRAALLLRREGADVAVWRGLHLHVRVRDQAGLDAAARAANLAGSMAVTSEALRRLARRRTAATIVVCDDVLTTGATAREAQRALSEVGLRVVAVAAVAATQRRHPPERRVTGAGPADF